MLFAWCPPSTPAAGSWICRRSALQRLPPYHRVGGAAEPLVCPLAPSFGSSLPFAIPFLLRPTAPFLPTTASKSATSVTPLGVITSHGFSPPGTLPHCTRGTISP